MDIKLIGTLCMVSQRFTLALQPTLVLVLSAFVAGEIPKIIRAGFRLDLELVTLALVPTLGIGIKAGFSVGFKLDLMFFNPYLTISAFVDIMFIKWCCSFLCLPCGLDWWNILHFQFCEFTLIPGPDVWEYEIVKADTGPSCSYYPSKGDVYARQLNRTHVLMNMDGFEDEEVRYARRAAHRTPTRCARRATRTSRRARAVRPPTRCATHARMITARPSPPHARAGRHLEDKGQLVGWHVGAVH